MDFTTVYIKGDTCELREDGTLPANVLLISDKYDSCEEVDKNEGMPPVNLLPASVNAATSCCERLAEDDGMLPVNSLKEKSNL